MAEPRTIRTSVGHSDWQRRLIQHAHENTHDLLAYLDIEGHYVCVSNSLCQETGYSEPELLDLSITDVDIDFSPDDWQTLLNELECGQRAPFESTLRRKNGTTFTVEISATLVSIDGRHFVCGNARNVTERKRAAMALAASEDRLQFALRMMDSGVWELDEQACFVHRSPAFDHILGYSTLDELWSFDRFVEHVIDSDRAMVRKAFEYAIATRSDLQTECRIRTPNGDLRWIWLAARHCFDPNASTRQLAGIIQDITAKKQAERTREHLAAIVGFSEDAIVSMDLNGIISSWNNSAERLFGYSPNEAIGQPISLIIPPERLAEERDIIQRVKHGERIQHFDTQRRRRDGMLVDISVTVSPLRDSSQTIVGASKVSRDITFRKRAEATLHESERFWRQLANSLPQLVWTCTSSGDCDFLSDRWIEYTGIPAEDQLGIGWLEQVHPDDREMLSAAWATSVATEGVLAVEFRIRRHDGTYRWFMTRAVPVRDALQRVMRWFGTNTDIEAERALREDLRTQTERLTKIAEASPGAIHSFKQSPDGRITFPYASKRIVDFYGIAPETLATDASAIFHLIHPDDVDRLRASIAESANNMTVWRDHWRVRHPEKGEIWLEGFSSPVREPDGGIVWHGVLTDITHFKHTEDTLRESEERLQIVTENAGIGLVLIDYHRRYTYANAAYYRIHGISTPSVVGLGVDEVLGEIYTNQVRDRLDRAFAGENVTYELNIDRPGGSRQYAVTYELCWREGKVSHIVVVLVDISERKQAELQLAQQATALQLANAELRRSNIELDAFAYVASHDLKEPLRGIHNYAQFLLSDYLDKLDSEGVDKLQTLQRLSERMRALIDALLHYSQLGRSELLCTPTDLNEVLAQVVEMVQARFVEQNLTVRILHPLPILPADRTLLTEVFMNLIVNALKYNDKSEKWVEVGCAKAESPHPVLYVRDNGIGIKPQHFAAIFGIFKRLHPRDAFGGGAGAGLTIVKKIIERHGGHIWVESEFQQGTTFYFTLTTDRESDAK